MITRSIRNTCLHALLLVALCALSGLWPTLSAAAAHGKTMIRLVCPVPLGEQTEWILAAKDESGAWIERKKLELRPSFISE